MFTEQITTLLEDDEYRQLQCALMLRPTQGPLIRGTGGLRKVRWRRPGWGKSGGVRVIYLWVQKESLLFMLFIYAKGAQQDLTPAQARVLRRIVEEELG